MRPSRVSPRLLADVPERQVRGDSADRQQRRLPGPDCDDGRQRALSDGLDLLETLDRFALVPDRQAETLEDGCLGLEGRLDDPARMVLMPVRDPDQLGDLLDEVRMHHRASPL